MGSLSTPVARQISMRAVVQTILAQGPTSRADLARLTGYSRQTIAEVVRDLEAEGWLKPRGRTEGRPGRSSTVYGIAGQAGLAAAIDLGGTKLAIAIGDLQGAILAESQEPTDKRGGLHVLDQIVGQLAALAEGIGATLAQLRLAVLGTPGVFHPETRGIDLIPNIAGFGAIDVPAELSARLGFPVTIENDVNLAARGEQWRGRGAGIGNFVFIAFGTGVGMGIVADGRLLRGARGAAGEIGYLPLGGDPYDPRGFALGTFETAVGSAAIAARYRLMGGAPDATVRDMFEAAAQGEAIAQAAIEETGRLVAPAIAAVAATLDPDLVILGGSIGARPELIAAATRALDRCTPNPPRVEASLLGSRAGLVGALGTALERMHEDLFGIGLPALRPGARA